MSALGHMRTFAVQTAMSALPPIADMSGAKSDVRLVPIADILINGETPGHCRGLISHKRSGPGLLFEDLFRCASTLPLCAKR